MRTSLTSSLARRKSGALAGDWVVLLGAGGGLGHLACQIAAKGMGMRVIGIDAGNKKDFVKECGAEVFIDHTQGKAEEEVMNATGGLGAQAVLVLTAANGAYARYCTRCQVVGVLTDSMAAAWVFLSSAVRLFASVFQRAILSPLQRRSLRSW